MQINSEHRLTFSNRWPFVSLPCPFSQLHHQQTPGLVSTLLSDNPNIFLTPCSIQLHTVPAPCKGECYLGCWTSCFFPKLVMGVTACRAVWFNLIAAAYENKTEQLFQTCSLAYHVKNNGRASWRNGMDWKMETSSHLWIVSEIDLSGDVVDGTYPLEGKKEIEVFELTCMQE